MAPLQEVQNLSGGELQRVAITLCLGQPADIYLIDEPSAYLDSEQRIIAAKVSKRCTACSLLECASFANLPCAPFSSKANCSCHSAETGMLHATESILSLLLQVLKRFIMHAKKTAFVVEHDFIMAAYLADRVVVYDGQPSKEVSSGPVGLPSPQMSSMPWSAGHCPLAPATPCLRAA